MCTHKTLPVHMHNSTIPIFRIPSFVCSCRSNNSQTELGTRRTRLGQSPLNESVHLISCLSYMTTLCPKSLQVRTPLGASSALLLLLCTLNHGYGFCHGFGYSRLAHNPASRCAHLPPCLYLGCRRIPAGRGSSSQSSALSPATVTNRHKSMVKPVAGSAGTGSKPPSPGLS